MSGEGFTGRMLGSFRKVMDRLKGIEVSEEVRVQGQVIGPQAGIQQTRDHEIGNDTAWLRNPNGNERPEHGSGGTGVNVSLIGSPMRQSEAALTPTAPPEPVVLGPNEQCGISVAPHSSEGKVGRQGLNAPVGVPQAFSTPLPNWDVKPEQTMLVNSDTRPHSLVHSDERRDRSGSRMSQPYADMSGQYAISSGSPNQSVRQNKMASLAPDFHHSVQEHADFASGLGSSNMPQSNYRPQTRSQEQTGEESYRTALSRAAVPPNQMALIRGETYGGQAPQTNFIPAVTPTGRTKQKPEKFDGSSDWSDYLNHFEMVSLWNCWSDEEKAVQLSMSLTSAARQAWSDSFCDGRIPLTYDSLVSALTQRFKPEGQEEAFKAEFRHRVRRKDESFLEFGHNLRRLAIRAFPRINHMSREELVVDQFLVGLSEVDMRRHVSLSHPANVDQAITLATEFETVTQSFKSPLAAKPKQVAAVSDVGATVGTGHGSSTDELLKVLIDLVKKQNVGQKPRNGPRGKNPNIVCYNCQNKGHIAKNCPARQTTTTPTTTTTTTETNPTQQPLNG